MRLRVTVVKPPAGVRFGIQSGRNELLGCVVSTGADLTFEVMLKAGFREGQVRFSGSAAQGPAAARFLYVCSGVPAGQPDSCWSRRAKVPLSGITWAMIELAGAEVGVLETRIQGIARDGGPACASVPLLDDGWQVRTTIPRSE